MAKQPNLYQPANGPTWLPDYTRAIEREIKRTIENEKSVSRAKGRFVYG